jgi:predicted metal-dependent hydrolase
LKIPDHGRGFQAMMSAWLPDWEERERRLTVTSIDST